MPTTFDAIDAFGYAWFGAIFFGLPLLGWMAMVVDYRAYVRSLRRALVLVRTYRLETPLWALLDRPQCLQDLELNRGCTRDEVMAAYRRLVKEAHPDLGGDRRRFDRLQQSLQEALKLVEVDEATRC